MATINSDLAARVGKAGSAGLTNPVTYQGKVQYVTAVVDLGSSLAANDILIITPPLPENTIVLPELCEAICHADPGTALVLDVGDTSDTDRYSDGLTLSSGGKVNFLVPAIPAGLTTRNQITTPTAIQALVVTATSITANSKITFLIAYIGA